MEIGKFTEKQVLDLAKKAYESGETIIAKYTWESEGTYQVKVKTLDILSVELDYGITSEWSDLLSVNMPKNKSYVNTPYLNFIENFLQQYPLIYQLLQRVLNH